MNYTTLPGTDLKISKIGLGTMTFGQQNSESEGHQQLDFALEQGVNFVDTAEMYPVPAKEATYGKTEAILGSWLKKTGKRSNIVLATKIAGANRGLAYIREDLRYTPQTIRLSVEKSLQRLQTDYIDLYQFHWPERKSNMFGQLGFKVQDDAWEDNTKAILETFGGLIGEGKIRHIGLSNETPWGLMRFLEESKKYDLPRMVSIQNPYSLVNRTFEIGLSEVAYREKVGFLAYSPLGFGVLTGKYLPGESHPEARLNLFPNFTRYNSVQTRDASALYCEIARKNGLSPVELALGFVLQQPFVASVIVGATSLAQLRENLSVIDKPPLQENTLIAIEEVQQAFPNPAP